MIFHCLIGAFKPRIKSSCSLFFPNATSAAKMFYHHRLLEKLKSVDEIAFMKLCEFAGHVKKVGVELLREEINAIFFFSFRRVHPMGF